MHAWMLETVVATFSTNVMHCTCFWLSLALSKLAHMFLSVGLCRVFTPLSQWIKLLCDFVGAATMSMELVRQYKIVSEGAVWTPTQKEENGKTWFAFAK